MPEAYDHVIEFGAYDNENTRAGGWVPMLWIDGRISGSTWSAYAWDRDEAETLAKSDAIDEAGHYVGDWRILVKPRA